MLRQAPIGVNPSSSFGALRCHEEERIIAGDGVVKEISDAVRQLCTIIIAAFAGPVQKDDQRQCFAYRIGFFGAIEPIGEGVVAFDVPMGLEPCGVGLLSE